MGLIGNNFIGQEILPNFYSSKIEKIINQRIEEINAATVNIDSNIDVDKSMEKIITDLSAQSERKKGLEDKVKAILFSISIAITGITFSLNYDKALLSSFWDILALLPLILSILYFIFSAIVSVKTLLPSAFHIYQTEIVLNNQTIEVKNESKEDQLKNLFKAKLLNDNFHTIIANYVYSALRLLRNGIVLFAVYFLIALIQKNLPYKQNNIEVSNKVKLKINDSTELSLPYTFKIETKLKDFKTENDSIKIKVIK